MPSNAAPVKFRVPGPGRPARQVPGKQECCGIQAGRPGLATALRSVPASCHGEICRIQCPGGDKPATGSAEAGERCWVGRCCMLGVAGRNRGPRAPCSALWRLADGRLYAGARHCEATPHPGLMLCWQSSLRIIDPCTEPSSRGPADGRRGLPAAERGRRRPAHSRCVPAVAACALHRAGSPPPRCAVIDTARSPDKRRSGDG